MGSVIDPAIARNFAIALLIGALVGIEREKKKSLEGSVGIGGIRTFILIAMTGALAGWISRELDSPWIVAAAVAGIAGIVGAGYVVQSRVRPNSVGLTTEMAAVAVALLGAASLLGHPGVAVALGIVVSATLAFKEPLHGIVGRLGKDDIYAGLKLLVATFIVLPLLPDRTVDPLGALNPHRIWLLVVLISSLSLVGYVAMRWLGPGRGTLLTGLAGGLVSSTAVTLTFARRSREAAQEGGTLATGILVAWGVMFVRVVIMAVVVHPRLAGLLLPPFAAMAAAAALAAAALYRRASGPAPATGDVPLTNPFRLGEAVRFGLFFAAVLVAVKLAERYLPGRGLIALATLAGFTNVDAITLSMAGYARDGGDLGTAVAAIAAGSLANTAMKGGIAAVAGAPALRLRVIGAAALVVVAGIAALFIE